MTQQGADVALTDTCQNGKEARDAARQYLYTSTEHFDFTAVNTPSVPENYAQLLILHLLCYCCRLMLLSALATLEGLF